MKKFFEAPEIEVIKLDADVITSSKGEANDENDLGWEPIN